MKKRLRSSAILVTLSLAGAGLLPPPPASALADTVGAVDLPMWQTNGIVVAMTVANNVLYVAGDFTSVRPPGAALGVDEVTRTRLAAFDATTGDLLPWDHSADLVVQALVPSPDGTRLYVGGKFNTIDGENRRRLAAFDTATGDLLADWTPSAGGNVTSLDAFGTTIYAGGSFTAMNGDARSRLAAVDETGATLPWAPGSDKTISALAVSDDGSRVVVGGYMDALNGDTSYHKVGIVYPAGHAQEGQNAPFADKSVIPCSTSRVTTLIAHGSNFYGGAEGTGGGCFDGTFAVQASDGVRVWRDGCLGATQAVLPLGDYLYVGSHTHNCATVQGGFPEQYPRANHLHAEGLTDGVIPHWWPNTNGQPLGPEALATDGARLFVGGDFTTVNKKPQQGLTVFDFTTNRRPPRPAAATATSTSNGRVNVTWKAVNDWDDETLTYYIYRDGANLPVGSVVASSKPWSLPNLTFQDTGLTPGSQHTYKVAGNDGVQQGPKSAPSNTVTVSGNNLSYPNLVLSDAPTLYWRLGETGGSNNADDLAPADNDGTYRNSPTKNQPGAIAGDSNRAVRFDGNNDFVSSDDQFSNPQTFSVEIWFKTTSTQGGKLAGFGSSQSGSASASYDRHLYLANDGSLIFGIYDGATRTVATGPGLNNGAWHHAVGTFGGNTMTLYIDGVSVGSLGTGPAQNFNGYWRIGGDSLAGWPSTHTSNYIAGTLDDFAVYPTALGPGAVADHYNRGLTPP
jgi:concanavalin A-like lectin/glucanase superfamily protein